MAKKKRKKANRPLRTENVPLDYLKPHPKNYRAHPENQIEELAASIRQHGLYRNIVIAREGTILAGHGVALAARRVGLKKVRIYRLDVDPDDPIAVKLLVADNELARLAKADDRALADLLREIREVDPEGLLGTGFDEDTLETLLRVTREAGDVDMSAEWVGMPEYEHKDLDGEQKITVHFKKYEDAVEFGKKIGQEVVKTTRYLWFPPTETEYTKDREYG